jgi:hypothetical protein
VTAAVTDFADGVDACHAAVAGSGPTGPVVGTGGGLAVASSRRLAGEPVRGCAALSWGAAPAADDEALAEFGALLVRLHWATLRARLDDVVGHLDARTSEGAALLHRQLVRGAIADVALALSVTEDLLDLPRSGQRLWVAHLGLVSAGRALLKLFGGASFLADGPGGVLYLAELLGNVYLLQETGNGRG